MKKKRILIVDDERAVLQVLSSSLRKLGDEYEIETTVNGFSALAYLQDSPFDLVITDYQMDDMNGLELMNNIHADWPETRVILITAYGNDRVKREAQDMGAYKYLLKPLEISDFRNIVKESFTSRDIAINRPGLLILSDKRHKKIMSMLEQLQADVGGRAVILTDTNGQVIASCGDTSDFRIEEIASLLSGGMATIQAAGSALDGDDDAINLSYREGKRDNMYGINIGQELLLIVIIENGRYSSKLGTAWYYSRQTAVSLRETVGQTNSGTMPQLLQGDINGAIDDQFDNLFGNNTLDDIF
jgi:CheY-like chemotaxis protein